MKKSKFLPKNVQKAGRFSHVRVLLQHVFLQNFLWRSALL